MQLFVKTVVIIAIISLIVGIFAPLIYTVVSYRQGNTSVLSEPNVPDSLIN